MTSHTLGAPGFRDDINGLRAWAVAAVVLFHFGLPGLRGGFVGVDVFFAISGFLMTGIVVKALERGRFSVWEFYLARARRIVPALAVLCAVLLAAGWRWLLPIDYKALGTHAWSSVAFMSNFKYWRESGYFDAGSHDKWLLHTWSLAVEWQFYLVLPLVLLAAWKLRPGRAMLLWVMGIGLLGSLALSVVGTPLKPIGAFFMLPTRAWEMLAGGLAWMLANRWAFTARQRTGLEAVGLGLVIVSLAAFDATSAWPGWRAMVPVAGAVAVLLAARPASPWTGNPVAQWLGTRSYSIYLWHWPIVVALNYAGWLAQPVAIAAGLALTLALGDLSYRLIETPARVGLGRLPRGWGALAMAAAAAMVVAPGLGVVARDGVAGRFVPEIEAVAAEARNFNPRREECNLNTGIASPSCVYGGPRIDAVVIGDSHANALVTAVAAALPTAAQGVMEWSYSACPTLEGAHLQEASGRRCSEFVDWTLEQLKRVPATTPVVIINRHGQYVFGDIVDEDHPATPWVYFTQRYATPEPAFRKEYTDRLTAMACRLAKDHPVYLVRPVPEMSRDVPSTARAMVWGERQEVGITLASYHRRHDFIWAAQDAARDQCGVKILDPLPYLCADGVCRGAHAGRPIYFDDDHMSEYGNKLLVPMFAEVFGAERAPATPAAPATPVEPFVPGDPSDASIGDPGRTMAQATVPMPAAPATSRRPL